MSGKQYPVEAYDLLDKRDEEQILAEIKGNIITEMFYSFPMDGRTVTGVSWVGTKEIARQYGGIALDFVRVDETDEAYIAVVKATDKRTETSLLGTALQPKLMKVKGVEKPDRFAYTKAVSKAQRNAIRAIIPERFLIEMYEAFKKGEPSKPRKPRKKVESQAKIVPTQKPLNGVSEQIVLDTLEKNGFSDEFTVYVYNDTIRIDPMDPDFDQQRFNEVNPCLVPIGAKWVVKEERWEIPMEGG